VGVELADHIIVADDDFVSLRHNGLLPERKGNGYGI
jgi:DNA repair protein RadC